MEKIIIEKRFGKLGEIKIGILNNLSQLINNKKYLLGEKEQIRIWSDYGQYSENRITLINDGNNENLALENFVFSNIVKDIFYWQLSNNKIHHHEFTIEGRDNTGRLFEATFAIGEEEIIPYIVYAMILISESPNVETAELYWKSLTGYSLDYLFANIGEAISTLIKIKELSQHILKKYPFMEFFFQKGLKEMIEKCKKELSKYDLLR